jgi:hypothetical protein
VTRSAPLSGNHHAKMLASSLSVGRKRIRRIAAKAPHIFDLFL